MQLTYTIQSIIIYKFYMIFCCLSVAKEVCKTVRENGAIPATVAVFDGCVHVGMLIETWFMSNEVYIKIQNSHFPI